MSQTKVKAGEGYVEIGLRSRIAEGARGVENELNQFGKNTMALGASLTAAAVGLLVAPVRAASDMEESMGKFNEVFGDSSGVMEQWATDTADAMGESKESMIQMVAGMQDLLVPMDVVPSKAAEMSKSLTTLAVDLASFNNMHTSDVFANLMSAITGEGQVMKKYGVILTETATKQELLNMSLDPDVADNAAKAQARLNIIMRGTTAAQGDAIRTADSHANLMKRLWSEVVNASGVIGGAFLDDMRALVQVTVSGVVAVRDFATNNQELVRAIGLATVAVGGLGVALVGLGVSAKVAAVAIGTVMMASQVAAAGAAIAWKAVAVAFTVLTLKSRVTAAVIQTTWTVAAKAIAIGWQAMTAAIDIAMKGAIAAVSVAAIAAPWIAGAALIAVAWFGVDAVMAATSLAAGAAWAAAAGVATTAWAASAGVLMPIALAIGGAYTATAAFISTAWAAVAAAFTGAGLAGVASATIVAVAWSALGAIQAALAAEATVSAALTSLAWSAAATVASLAWAGFSAVLSAALTPATLLAAAGFAVSGAWTVGAAVVSAAWTAAWAVITGPLLPFLAVGAGVVALFATMAGGIAALAIQAADLGAAFGKAREMISGVVRVVTEVFDTLKLALGSGDYATAAQALWASIRLAFWEGAGGALSAFKWLFEEGQNMAGRFFKSLLDTTWRIMKAVATAIMNPFESAKEIGNAIADLASSATGFSVSDRASAARAELAAIRGTLKAENQRKQNATDAKKLLEENISGQERLRKKIEEINRLEQAGALTPDQATSARKKATAAATGTQMEKDPFAEKRSALQQEIAALERGEEAALRMKLAEDGLTQAQIESVIALNQKKEALEQNERFADKVTAIENEIIALKMGEEAAERKRLIDEGYNETQIRQIELLNRKRKALEEAAEAEKAMAKKRVKEIFNLSADFEAGGMSPDEIFKRVMSQIESDEKSGLLDKETAGNARETARDNLDSQTDRIADQARMLIEAMRTPAEKLNAELAKISNLQDRGLISDETALRAEDDVRGKFKEEQERIDKEQERTGPNATFSAVAATIIGAGSNPRNEELKTLQTIAGNSTEQVKLAKKQTAARVG
jgi:hypothetical protein